ncbi:MAG: DUF4393 domain-containing protein [Pseudomonadota bacterium]
MYTKTSKQRSNRRRSTPPTRRRESPDRNVKPLPPSLPNAFNEVSAQIWDLDRVKAFTITTVEEILQQRNVPKHQTRTPNLEITIPAIEAMRYSPLRREIAALIATSMDQANADFAHPSYLNILQQLTEDEIRILRAFPGIGRVLPMAHLWNNLPGGQAQKLYRNILPADIARVCKTKSRLPLYIDNLTRLQLIHEPDGVKIGDARIYANLVRQGFCTKILEQPGLRKNTSLERRTIALSEAGETFRNVCLI